MKGIPVSQGIAIGRAFVYKKEDLVIEAGKLAFSNVENEIERLENAILKSKDELAKLKQLTESQIGRAEAVIFSAHSMILDDPEYTGAIRQEIKKDLLSAETAADKITKQFVELFDDIQDEYFRERAADIKDVGDRLLRNLLGISNPDLSLLAEDVIIVARDLTPSDTAQMNRKKVLGFATEVGGKTSHTAIMAKSLEIPAVLGLGRFLEEIEQGGMIIVNGNTGEVTVNPDPGQIEETQKEKRRFDEYLSELAELKFLPAETPDGRRVELVCNIGTPEDVSGVLKNGGEGVGLYRTEFLFMNCPDAPTEEIQFEAYKKVLEEMGPKPVIIRTLDIGGDKKLDYLHQDDEMNPFLGLRAIRLCFREEALFKTQLRAILRASHYGNAYIMFPMISNVEEVRQAKKILRNCMDELRQENTPYDRDIKVGIMVEIPSAAVTADLIAKEVDFFSIGTNDLCQYTIAVDRMNEKTAYLYEPLHPAILRLVKSVIDAAHEKGIMTGMCGEMAGDEYAAVALLGLGLDEFSMSASSVPKIKKIIRGISYQKAQKIAKEALQCETASAVLACIKSEMEKQSPEQS